MKSNKTALLVIDIQKGLTSKSLYKSNVFFQNVNLAIDKIRSYNGLVVFTQHNNNIIKKGYPEWEFDQRLHLKDDDVIVQKRHCCAFDNTNLFDMLKDEQIETIYVCGLVSHNCVRSTCIGANNKGFKVTLISDGHTNFHDAAYDRIEETNDELAEIGIQLITVDLL